MKKDIRKSLAIIMCICLALTGCGYRGLAHDSTFNSQFENIDGANENIYVSSAHLIFRGYDPVQQLIDFVEIGTGEIVELSYDGTTVINDRYQNPLSISQLQCGDIVNIAYSSPLSKVGAIVKDPSAFEYSDITKYSISDNGENFHIGDETFKISNDVVVFSAGQIITKDQLILHDNITIQGEGSSILSIRVDQGHGYLKLENEDALVGGWIEIGQNVISEVLNDMLFTVPEGDYTVHLTNTGIDETRTITIARNEVTTLDLGDIESQIPEKGIVSFRVIPNTSAVYVDGSYINLAHPIKLPVGTHEITASASGYPTVSEYFNVTGINQTVELDLTDGKYNTGSVLSSNTLNKNLYATVTVEAPVGAELYEDNIYKGITPASYQKTSGTHTLTLYKPGYETKSYTVVMYDDGKDQTFSFSDLIPESSLSSNSLVPSSSLSGNTLSQNSLNKEQTSTVSGNSLSGNSLN
ncbi:MAG: PEGA domain-containing protein [Lachnospiraceae bacterium]|nr:PEGA domain-containing protein [Lachnospiraceae bacterium]